MKQAGSLNLKNILINSTFGYVATFVMLGLGIVTKMLLARLLNPFDFGLLVSAQVIVGLATFLASLGLSETTARFVGLYAETDMRSAKGVIQNALRLTLIWSIFISIVLVLISPFIARGIYNNMALGSLLLFWALSIPFKTLADILGAVYQGIGQLWAKIVFIDIFPSTCIVVLLGMLTFMERHAMLQIVTGIYVTVTILSSLLIFNLFRRNPLWGIKPAKVDLGNLLRYGLPLLGSGVVAWPLSMMPLIIGSMTTPGLVAYYSLSISLASFIYMGVSVMELASLPVWSAHSKSGLMEQLNDDYKFITRWGFVIGTIPFVLLFICPEDVLALAYGKKYVGASGILFPIAVTFLINAVTGPNESILKALGCTRWIFLTRLSVGAVVLVSAYPLIKVWGINGAVALYMISVFVGVGMYSGYLLLTHNIIPFNLTFIRTFFASAAALIVAWWVHNYLHLTGKVENILITLLVYLVALSLLLVTLRAFTSMDLIIFRSFYRWVGSQRHNNI